MGVEGQTVSSAVEMTGLGRRVLIIVENLPCPFDRRVWQEARTLAAAGYLVSIICPKGKGYEKSFEEIDGIAIYRHVHAVRGRRRARLLRRVQLGAARGVRAVAERAVRSAASM